MHSLFLLLIVCTLGGVAHAGDTEDVRAFFDHYVALGAAFDPSIADLYSPDARILTLRDGSTEMQMSGAQYKQLIQKVMPIAKKRGDTSSYEDVKVAAHKDGYRVTAIRIPAIKCAPDPNYHLDAAKIDGSWLIVDEYTETLSLSRCKPSPKLAAILKATKEGIEPSLPLDLDSDTRLESVDIVGSALIYNQRLHTITAGGMDLAALVPMLR